MRDARGHAGPEPTLPPPGVLRLITRLNIGGPARQALLLTRALREDYPTVLASGTPPSGEGELRDPDVQVTPVSLVRAPDPRRDLAAVAQVRALLRRHGTRLVHTHMAKAGAVGRVAAATMRPRPRTVHTFHGHVLEGYFSPGVERAFVLAERALARRTDVLVAVSDEVRDDLLALGIGRPDQYRVVPLGFDLRPHLEVAGRSGLLRAHLGLDGSVPLVGVLGRLAPIKRHDVLLQALADVPGAHLAVLGDGEQRGALEDATATLGLSGRVHFTGWWHDVPAAMADLDVVALSSRNEGTPVSLIEASAAGRPVVSTDVGGVRSVVCDGQTGYLVSEGDHAALAERLTVLLDDGALRETMGRAGRAHVRERFSQERLVRDIRGLYGELLGGA